MRCSEDLINSKGNILQIEDQICGSEDGHKQLEANLWIGFHLWPEFPFNWLPTLACEFVLDKKPYSAQWDFISE